LKVKGILDDNYPDRLSEIQVNEFIL